MGKKDLEGILVTERKNANDSEKKNVQFNTEADSIYFY